MCQAWDSMTSASVPEMAREQGPGKSRQSITLRVIRTPPAARVRARLTQSNPRLLGFPTLPLGTSMGSAMDRRRAERVRGDIVRVCHSAQDSVALRREVIARLRSVVPFDAVCCPTADPATLMITDGVSEGLPAEASVAFAQVEYGVDDY